MVVIAERLESWARGLLIAGLFLVPVVAFPWTGEPTELNKFWLLLILSTLAGVSWLIVGLMRRQFTVVGFWPLLLLLGFLLAVALSSFLSLAPALSWLGLGTQAYVGWVGSLSLVVFAVLSAQLLITERSSRSAMTALLAGAAFTSLWVLLDLFGLPLGSLANPIGAPQSLGLYFLALFFLAAGICLADSGRLVVRNGSVTLPLAVFVLFTAGIFLAVLDSSWLWILALVVGLCLFAVAFWRSEMVKEPVRFVPLMALILEACIFLVSPWHLPSHFPAEVAPDAQATLSIAWQTLSEGRWVWGSGPGTFAFDYSRFHDADVNATEFWDTTFDRGYAHVLTLLATYGLLGTGLLLGFITVMCFLLVKTLWRQPVAFDRVIPVVGAWLTVTLSLGLYASNFSLLFLFFALSGLLLSRLIMPVRILRLSSATHVALGTVFTIIVGLGGTTLIVINSLRYVGDIFHTRAWALDQQGGELDDVTRLIDRAATLNRWEDAYFRSLATVLVAQAATLSQVEPVDENRLRATIAGSLEASNTAVRLSPNNLQNWRLKGTLYQEVAAVQPEALPIAREALEEAVSLSPNNPDSYVRLARVVIAEAEQNIPMTDVEDDVIAKEASQKLEQGYAEAEQLLNEALRLKSDYVPAMYSLAYVQEQQGRLAEAIKHLEVSRDLFPYDTGVGMQLALLYLKQGKNQLGKAELQRILTIAPTFANAHWFLSVAYELENDLPSAISEVEKILEVDPGNSVASQRLERLQQGGRQTELPPPLEEDKALPAVTQ